MAWIVRGFFNDSRIFQSFKNSFVGSLKDVYVALLQSVGITSDRNIHPEALCLF
jgi:hypothetical protein